jgi:hypothetical protein
MDNINKPDEQKINDQFNQQFGKAKDLPNATPALVLGIISTVFGLFWCYWVGSLVGIVCGIIAISMSNGGKKLVQDTTEIYSRNSISNNDAGKILGIIGICLGSIGMLILIAVLVFFGLFATGWH